MSGWHRAIAFALTGSDLDLGEQEAPDLDVLVEQLDRNGWDADALGDHARAAAAAGPWPHPVPDALRAGLGAAQLYAAIGGARERYVWRSSRCCLRRDARAWTPTSVGSWPTSRRTSAGPDPGPDMWNGAHP